MIQRLFVAVAVPQPVRGALAAVITPLRARYDRLRWVPPTQWHLTLAFLGAITTAQRLRAQLALQSVARSRGPFDVALDGRIGRFGDRVLWAGIADDGHLGELASAVRDALRASDVPCDERAFHPHLTVARSRRGRPVPRSATRATTDDLAAGWTVDRLVLIVSRPDMADSRYRDVATWPLTG